MSLSSLICKRPQYISGDVVGMEGLSVLAPPAARLLPALPFVRCVTLGKMLNISAWES